MYAGNGVSTTSLGYVIQNTWSGFHLQEAKYCISHPTLVQTSGFASPLRSINKHEGGQMDTCKVQLPTTHDL